jgi:hypothetical protein
MSTFTVTFTQAELEVNDSRSLGHMLLARAAKEGFRPRSMPKPINHASK